MRQRMCVDGVDVNWISCVAATHASVVNVLYHNWCIATLVHSMHCSLISQLCRANLIFTARAGGQRSIDMVKQIIPTLSHDLHKGLCGRIGVIGGSKEYTGAPYYAAISALKTGADLAHVICPPEAAAVIKSYSPELIVHPILVADSPVSEILGWLERFHAVVLGPGLGRNIDILPKLIEITDEVKRRKLPLIIDADGLFYVTENINLIRDYPRAILTPNVVEFVRLHYAVMATNPDRNSAAPEITVKNLSAALGNVTIIQKGREDVISDGKNVLFCSESGSPRRCGGQGDLLSGSLGTLAAWANEVSDRVQLTDGPWLTAAYCACYITRKCNEKAYAKFRRSTTTVDMVNMIHEVMLELENV